MIPAKKKPCKGIGPAKGFKGCNKPTKHRTHGLGKMCGCYAKWLLTTQAGQAKMERAALKATKPRRELQAAEKEHSEQRGITSLLNNLKKACHEYIRLRDKGKPCASCGSPWNEEFQAGHYFKAETYSGIRFHPWNINGQCVQCNIHLEGNFDGYSLLLPDRIGKEAFDELHRLAANYKRNEATFKWDREELKAKRNYFKNQIKQLKNPNS